MVDDDPRRYGKALKHELKGLWRYRIGDYRAICQILDNQLIVLILVVAHHRNIYQYSCANRQDGCQTRLN